LWSCSEIQRHDCRVRIEGCAKIVREGCRSMKLLRGALEWRRCCRIPEQTLLWEDRHRLRVQHGLREEVRRELHAREEVGRLWYHSSTWSFWWPHTGTITLGRHPPLLLHGSSPVYGGRLLLRGSKWFCGQGWCVEAGCLGSSRCCCRDRVRRAKNGRRGGQP